MMPCIQGALAPTESAASKVEPTIASTQANCTQLRWRDDGRPERDSTLTQANGVDRTGKVQKATRKTAPNKNMGASIDAKNNKER